MSRGTLYVVIGPVGAGKSTYARAQAAATGSLFLDVDIWMVRMFGDDERPSKGVLHWYRERRDRCRAVLLSTALDALNCGVDVYMEYGLVTREERVQFFQQAHDQGYPPTIFLLDAPRDIRRARVAVRNLCSRAFVQVVPPAFFEAASDAWEPPSVQERDAWGMVEIS